MPTKPQINLVEKEQAIADAEMALRGNPEDVDLRIKLGWAYFEAGRYGEAIAVGEKTVHDQPSHFGALGQLGWAYFWAERYDDAMKVFQLAADVDPEDARPHHAIGWIYERLGKPEKAVETYRHALKLDPESTQAYHGLAVANTALLGDYEAAIEACQRAIEIDPEERFLRGWLGLTYARMGDVDRAAAFLQETLRLQPDNDDALGNLAIVYLYQKRYDDVIATCRRQLDLVDDVSAHRMLGLVYHHLGRHGEAISELEQATALDPSDFEARAALSRVLRTVGRESDADEQYVVAEEQAAQKNEYDRACLAALTGDVEQAVALVEVGFAKKQLQPGWARMDPEFMFIRDDPRFQTLLESRIEGAT